MNLCMGLSLAPKFFCQVFYTFIYGRNSVFFRWRCDMLRTSGSVHDVMFSYSGPCAGMTIPLHRRRCSAVSCAHQTLCSAVDDGGHRLYQSFV